MSRTVNLMPHTTQAWLERRRQIKNWIRVWLGVGLMLVFWTPILREQHVRRRHELEQAQTSVAEVRQAALRLNGLTAEINSFRSSVEAAEALEQRDVPLALIQVIAQTTGPLAENLQLKSIKMTEHPCGASGPPVNPQIPSTANVYKELMLVGEGQSEACTTLVRMLRAHGAFREVELISTQSVSDQNTSLQSFQVRCSQ